MQAGISVYFYGSNGTLTCHFTTYLGQGLQASGGGNPYFGAKKVELVD